MQQDREDNIIQPEQQGDSTVVETPSHVEPASDSSHASDPVTPETGMPGKKKKSILREYIEAIAVALMVGGSIVIPHARHAAGSIEFLLAEQGGK